MALSNMFKEPRREITETGFGVVGLFLLFVPCYFFVLWLAGVMMAWDATMPRVAALFLATLALVMGAATLPILFGIIHEMGEFVCDVLKKHGLDPRPRCRASASNRECDCLLCRQSRLEAGLYRGELR